MADLYDEYLRQDFERAIQSPSWMLCPELRWNVEEEWHAWVTAGPYLDHCRRRWEKGYFPAAGYAALFCTYNELPLPDWLADVANHALLFAMDNGGSPGKGKTGRYRTQARRLEKYVTQYEAVCRRLELGAANMAEACDLASNDLRSTEAQASPDQLRKIYYKVPKAFGHMTRGAFP